ncbi:eta DNA polymerase [Fomitiporia mediterranea MF3/22]|uniref:eta DNA polymerase n=1 Tax=Fomitiporia mediterranea (strain MF3/22) TaxID=694068 RepID=UPI0004409A49|nr:eta DNA polymerase [Fomitiporia mediterranea MF3/22]EJD06732.1 eta DNA polymerase [Fomitiporia mediterranea MF3/22]
MSATPSSPTKKGKLKQFNSDYDDLDPVITYRHLQSSVIGPSHPLRIVALCDCNAFYANCEQVRLGLDPEIPLVVLQWGMLIAVNYPARKFGISRMDKLDEARKRCPDLVVVHVATYAQGEDEPKYWDKPDVNTHKISLDLYRRESVKIHSMFKDQLPTGEVGMEHYFMEGYAINAVLLITSIEKASIDEAFIDFSIPVRDELLKRYPYLSEPPVDSPSGPDTPLPPPPRISYIGLGNLIPIDPPKLDPEKEATTELIEEIEKDAPATWQDVGLAIAAELMASMRKEVHEKLGYLTSAGIARNKFLAKLAASYRKFNTQNILRNLAIPGFLKPMPFQKIRFLGGKLGKALATEYDVSTVGDLLHIGIEEMQSKFGECSVWVYEILRGIDRAEVKEKAVINKSMNASKNLPKPLTDPSEGPHWIRMLAAELAIRLNEARENTPGLWPRTLSLHTCQGWHVRRSKQQAFPPPRSTNVTADFMTGEAEKLWKEIVKSGILWDGKDGMKVTHLGLGLTGIGWTEEGQQNIQGFFRAKAPTGTERAVSEGVAGPSTYATGREALRQRSQSVKPGVDEDEIVVLDIGDESGTGCYSFTCARCRKIISLPPHLLKQGEVSGPIGDNTSDVEELRQDALAVLRMEHDDYHFAQDLARQDKQSTSSASVPEKRKPSSSSTRQVKKRKKEHQPEGIARFFIKERKP